MKPSDRQTECGDIPEEWSVETIGKLLEEKAILEHLDGNHGELYPRSHEFKSYGVPYIGANDFDNGNVSFEHCKYLEAERASKFRKGVAKDGDVLFAHNATVGPVALLRTTLPAVILSTTATYFRCDPEKLNNLYLKSALQSDHFVRQYRAVMAQSTRFQVPITAQRKLSLVIPPVFEQRAIATVFGDMDGLLAKLDHLIAKKADLRQAAMQQLVTGQIRLPGFHTEWRIRNLGALADIRSGGTPSTGDPQAWNGTIPWCTPTDITALDGGKYLNQTSAHITPHGLNTSAAEIIPERSVVMTTRATIGECAINTVPVSTNQGFKNFVPFQTVDVEFLFYLLLRQKQGFMRLCSGSTFLEIGKSQLSAYEVRLPVERDEQTAIAQVLAEMDAEIAALEQRREKTRALKRAMMQELLTGKTRLI